jgi:hypothetical protein
MLYATLPPMQINTNVQIGSLAEADGALIAPRLRRLNARTDEGRTATLAELGALTGVYPGSAEIWYEYAKVAGDMDDDVRDLSLVKSAAGRALAINPDHVGANLLQSTWLLEAAYDDPDATAEHWQAARDPIVRALRAEPDNAVALVEMFRSYQREGARPPDAARAGLARAFLIVPEVIEYRAEYAMDLVNQGQFPTAIALVRTIAFSPHDNGQGVALLRQIEAMRDRAAGSIAVDAPDKDEVEAAGE